MAQRRNTIGPTCPKCPRFARPAPPSSAHQTPIGTWIPRADLPLGRHGAPSGSRRERGAAPVRASGRTGTILSRKDSQEGQRPVARKTPGRCLRRVARGTGYHRAERRYVPRTRDTTARHVVSGPRHNSFAQLLARPLSVHARSIDLTSVRCRKDLGEGNFRRAPHSADNFFRGFKDWADSRIGCVSSFGW